ncbi:MAG: penicillin-binding protein, partial [Pseudomonadota bacterium]
MSDTEALPPLQYVRYRLSRDLGGALAWVSAKWRSSWLFKLAVLALVLLALLWVVAWAWLARDLPEAGSLVDYETPLPTVVRGIDGEIVHSYARERRVQLQYADFPEQLIEAYLSAEDKTFFSH